MILAVQNLLRSYEALPEIEKREFASEILRRSQDFDLLPLSDEQLASLADELFRKLDESENTSQKPHAGCDKDERLWSQFSIAQAMRGMENEDRPVYTRDDLKEDWFGEAQRRARELDAGTVKPIPAEEVRRKTRALLR